MKDESGGRRFWPVKKGVIDIDGLAEDRDQLFAEAVQMYVSDDPWWPDRDFEQKFIKPEQGARFEADAWQELLVSYLTTQMKVTISQVAQGALFFDRAKLGTADQRRIAAILELLGWRRLPKDREGKRFWARSTTADGV